MAIGVFGLGVVYNLQKTSSLSDLSSYGWFGGGATNTPAVVSTVDRIDFSNDSSTSSSRGPLSTATYRLAATGNSNYGWFGGGATPTVVSTVNRIDFSNDSATASVKGPLPLARFFLAATGNSSYGWFGGGASPTTRSAVERIDFSNDSAQATPRGPLFQGRSQAAATGNSNYGWFGGGYIPPLPYSTVDRIDFSNDSVTASVRGPLSLERSIVAATGNSNYGWFGGGESGSVRTTVDRIDFSNDSATASIRGPLSLAKDGLAATGNSNYGWFGGGGADPATSVSTIDRIDFSNDSVTASSRGRLSLARRVLASTSGQAKSSSIRLQKAGNFGWFGGGIGPAVTVSTVDRIDFSNDSVAASSRGPLSTARYGLAATGNSNYGWFGLEDDLAGSTIVDRVNFSNDLATSSPRGPLTSGRYYAGAAGNSNYGWFGGGYLYFPSVSALYFSVVDRINFANDLSTAVAKGSLNKSRGSLAASGNSNYAWFAGGGGYYGQYGGPNPYEDATSMVDRINFSNDSASISIRGSLSQSRYGLAATGNSNYGWFGGGYTTSPTYTQVSTVDRIDFSNDSATASPRGSLIAVRTNLAATGNSNYGWFGGGALPAPRSSVYRIDFSNDSVAASPRGPLFLARSYLAATSNTPVG